MRTLKFLALPLAAVAVLAVATFAFARGGVEDATAGAITDIYIDAVPGGAIDATTAPLGPTGVTSIRVGITSIGPANYAAYQVKFFYNDVILDAGLPGNTTALPANWNLPPDANTGGNLQAFVSGADCAPVPGGNALQDNNLLGDTSEDDLGINSLLMSCGDAGALAVATTPAQDWVEFYFECSTTGLATVTLATTADPQGGTFAVDADTLGPSGDAGPDSITINCNNPPTATATNTPLPPTVTNTPLPNTATFTPTNTNTPVPGSKVCKDPDGTGTNVVDAAGCDDLPLANLFLCESGPCSGTGEGDVTFVEVAEFAGGSFDPPGPALPYVQVLGAFEFQIKYDHKIFDLTCEPGNAPNYGANCASIQNIRDNVAGEDPGPLGDDRQWEQATQCFVNVTENYINYGCTSTDPTDTAPVGDDGCPTSNPCPEQFGAATGLARVTLLPDGDLRFRISPGNDNGVVRVVLDENCELADQLGHPLAGSVSGGLTVICGDIAITVRILEGDLDLNCLVDTVDAQLIAQRYGMVFGLFLYDPWFDLEPNIKDFDIDVKDLQKVFGRQGSNCQVPIPPQPPVDPGQP